MRIVVVILVTLMAVTLFASLQCTAKARPKETTVAASPFLMERVKNNEWLLIDVRSPEEFNEGHIPGAINMPHKEISNYLDELEDYKDKPIIIYCRSGRRAKMAMKELADHDFSEVMHLEGDMLGWNAANMPIDRM